MSLTPKLHPIYPLKIKPNLNTENKVTLTEIRSMEVINQAFALKLEVDTLQELNLPTLYQQLLKSNKFLVDIRYIEPVHDAYLPMPKDSDYPGPYRAQRVLIPGNQESNLFRYRIVQWDLKSHSPVVPEFERKGPNSTAYGTYYHQAVEAQEMCAKLNEAWRQGYLIDPNKDQLDPRVSKHDAWRFPPLAFPPVK